jgi:hypothetical protein
MLWPSGRLLWANIERAASLLRQPVKLVAQIDAVRGFGAGLALPLEEAFVSESFFDLDHTRKHPYYNS